MFLWHYPSAHADQPLTGTLPYGARTFLEQSLATIARDYPAYFHLFIYQHFNIQSSQVRTVMSISCIISLSQP